MRKASAIIIFPFVADIDVIGHKNAKWLSKGIIKTIPRRYELISYVLSYLGIDPLEHGCGFFRYFGQGMNTDSWIAAADPIFLQARMRDIVVHNIPVMDVTANELKTLFDFLQEHLGKDNELVFEVVGNSGYIKSKKSMQTPKLSANHFNGSVLPKYRIEDEMDNALQQLQTEIQMLLHEHEINVHRENLGKMPINSLWIWGGGIQNRRVQFDLPTLYAKDELFTGLWDFSKASVRPWPREIKEFFKQGESDFVAVMPAGTSKTVEYHLDRFREQLFYGDCKNLILIFSNYVIFEVKKTDFFKFWKPISRLIYKEINNA